MLGIFAILSIGLLAGWMLRRRKRLISVCELLITATLLCLMGVLGAWVGCNEEVMGNLPELSLQAGSICLCSVAGSILLFRLAGRVLRGRPVGDS